MEKLPKIKNFDEKSSEKKNNNDKNKPENIISNTALLQKFGTKERLQLLNLTNVRNKGF